MQVKEYLSPRYRWIYYAADDSVVKETVHSANIPRALVEVLIKRGLTGSELINDYFSTPLASLINPFLMKDMAQGVARIIQAVKNNELICIFGDYDVDGITSTTLLYLFFKELGANVTHYIPNRLEEGYGLSMESIDELAGKKVKLLVTVDCGISAVDEVAEAMKRGIDVVVTDHHQTGEKVPAALAVINPMQEDDTYAFKSLSGVGVAFKLCMAIRHTLRNDPEWRRGLPNLKQYLDIVALGTIADVVPLQGENRTFVVHGLQVLASGNARPGVDELKKISGITHELTSYHIGFGLAPRINAVGRLGNSGRGFRLLVTNNRIEARNLAIELDQENKFRQNIEREILQEVFDKITREKLHEKHGGLVLYARDWHPGVLGIVASRVVDKFHRPTIIMTEENGIYKGSARSIPAFHLYDGLKSLSDMLLSFGGHKYAAGLKVSPENIGKFAESFDKLVKESLTERDYIPEIHVDAFLQPKDINTRFMETLSRFEPYGNSNKEPVFYMPSVELYQRVSFVGKDSAHAKCYFTKDGVIFDAIGYEMKIYEELFLTNTKFDIIFTLAYNNYGRSKSIQLMLKDVKPASSE